MFGWLYVPSEDSVYWGGPHDGAWRTDAQGCERKLQLLPAVSAREVNENSLRIVVGSHDRRSHPEIMQRHDINWVLIGSSGMKVIGILNGKADVFVHFAKQMKIWDTAGPCAIAYGANLEAGTLDGRELVFDLPKTQHSTQVVVGRKGTIAWSGQVLAEFVDP
jgi:3'(2'), 5'-bisphosphate nucleotidase